jgi:Conjugative transposon protein TcpC
VVASREAGLSHTADWLLADLSPDVSRNPPRNGHRTRQHEPGHWPESRRQTTADITAERADQFPIWQSDGAPAASMPGLAGRFAAEWCPTGITSRREYLRRARASRVRTDGGVMDRRAILERGEELTADDEALPLSQPPAATSDQVAAHWRGAGGRWLVWVARAVAWAVLILIGYRGVLAIIEGNSSSTRSGPSASASATTQFPVMLASAYALEFGDVYLNFSPATAAQRGQDLARFLPLGADPQLGWNGVGTQRLQDEQVSGVSVTGSHTAVVTLLARLSNGGLIELAVPIYAANGGMAVSGDPALLPGPAKAAPPQVSQQPADQATETALQDQLPAFFQAYASGDQTTLARFASPGAHIVGLGGAVTFGAIDSVYAPVGGASRNISVTVTWQLTPASRGSVTVAAAPGSLQMTYQMTVIQQGGSWGVQSIGPSTLPLAQGPP